MPIRVNILKIKNWTLSLKMFNCEENCSVFKEVRVVKWNEGCQISLDFLALGHAQRFKRNFIFPVTSA